MATAEIEQGIHSLLSGNLGAGVGTDVFAGIAPKNTRAPFVTFQRISGGITPWRAINGPSGLTQSEFQIDVWSDDFLESRTVAKAIRLILDGFKGNVTIGADSVRIGACSIQSERDFTEPDTDPKLYQASTDYLFTYDEDI